MDILCVAVVAVCLLLFRAIGAVDHYIERRFREYKTHPYYPCSRSGCRYASHELGMQPKSGDSDTSYNHKGHSAVFRYDYANTISRADHIRDHCSDRHDKGRYDDSNTPV